jgi:enoyl-CoA hydratase/carnithine racemase
MSYAHRTIIAPAAVIAAVRTLAAVFPGTGGELFLPRAMSPTGKLPATHYGASGFVGTEFADVLPVTHIDAETGAVTRDAIDAAPLAAMAADMGMPVPAAHIAALLAACVVTERGFDAELDRLGLVLLDGVAE